MAGGRYNFQIFGIECQRYYISLCGGWGWGGGVKNPKNPVNMDSNTIPYLNFCLPKVMEQKVLNQIFLVINVNGLET